MLNLGETYELQNYVDELGNSSKVYFMKRIRNKIKVKLLTKAKKKIRGRKYYDIGTEWCIDEFEIKQEHIPIQHSDDRFTCKICFTNPIDYVSRCGHCICHSCKIQLRKFNCPFCRKNLSGNLIRIHNH